MARRDRTELQQLMTMCAAEEEVYQYFQSNPGDGRPTTNSSFHSAKTVYRSEGV